MSLPIIRYSEWTETSTTDEQRLEKMIELFSYLSLAASGNLDDVFDWLKELAQRYNLFDESMTFQDLLDTLKEQGLIEEIDGSFELSNKGTQKIRTDALKEIFSSLKKSQIGQHTTPKTGIGTDRTSDIREWNFGDTLSNVDMPESFRNVLRRQAQEVSEQGNFDLEEEDLRVYETEHLTKCATVILLDISHSMILYGEDRITPAKKVALALHELIKQKFPRDFIALITFGDDAQLVSLAELPFLQVGPYHTNTRAGLQMARSLLRRQKGNTNKQIFMITDGKPSAMFDEAGRLYKNPYGLDPTIITKTLDEAVACRREKITVSTFMLAQDAALVRFVEDFTKINHGRAYYTGLGNLGEMLFVDYLRNRQKRY